MSTLSELLALARPATQAELRAQGESLARNYRPGPRQARMIPEVRVYTVRVSRFLSVDVAARSSREAEDDALDVANGAPERCWETDTEVTNEAPFVP